MFSCYLYVFFSEISVRVFAHFFFFLFLNHLKISLFEISLFKISTLLEKNLCPFSNQIGSLFLNFETALYLRYKYFIGYVLYKYFL